MTACLPERRQVTEDQYVSGNTDDEGYVCQLACLKPSRFITAPYLLSDFSQRTSPLSLVRVRFTALKRALNSSFFCPLDQKFYHSQRLECLKVLALTGNQTIYERYDGSSSFGIYAGKPIIHTLLIRRVAGALLCILLLLISLTTLNCSIRSFQLDLTHKVIPAPPQYTRCPLRHQNRFLLS